MVVECKKCGTRFQLDAEQIPDAGIRVRCSRCKHAFFLQHPSQSQANAVAAVVEQAVTHESTPPPGSTQDLGAPSADAASDVFVEANVDDEDDWEFNEDLPSHDDSDGSREGSEDELQEGWQEEVAVEALDEDLGGIGSIDFDHDSSFSSSQSGVDLASASDPDDEVGEVALDPTEIGTDDLSASSMSVGSSSTAAASASALHAESEAVRAPVAASGGEREDVFGSVDDFSTLMDADEEVGIAPPLSSDDDAGEDPENWDFLAEATPNHPSGLSTGSGPLRAPAGEAVAEALAQTASDEPDTQSEWLGLDDDRQVGAMTRIASSLAWVAVVGLSLSGVYLGVMTSFDYRVTAPAFVSIGEMRAANVRGRWLETARAGTLYLVTGDLVNPSNETRAPRRAVRVSLLADDGSELDLSSAFAGSDVEIDALRRMSIGELQDSQQLAAHALASAEIGPGKSAHFAAAFVSVPAEASHFRLYAAEPEQIGELALASDEIPTQATIVAIPPSAHTADAAGVTPRAGASGVAATSLELAE